MQLFKYSWLVAALVSIASCSKDDGQLTANEVEGLTLVKTMDNNTHIIDVYTKNGRFETGYNEVFFQIKDQNGNLINNATANWTPVMQMMGMSHSCPASSVVKKSGASSTYTGFIIYQMAGNETEYWELTINYIINNTDYSVTNKVDVSASEERKVESFQGSDDKKYIIALVQPVAPRVAINDMTAVLFEMRSMMEFVVVDNYTIKIDPRMPGMNNHGSPNNVDLTQNAEKLYSGKLSLTMTGYWKINLQLFNQSNELIKGEAVTSENEGSSIYCETEF